MLSKAQERALRVGELLDRVLQLLEPADLASCARVSHYWELPSLCILWRDSPPHDGDLLKILGELHPWKGPICFKVAPSLDNWKRFHRYASLIKGTHITIQKADSDSECVDRISPRTVHQIRVLAEAERVPMFPNLAKLTLQPLDQSSCEAAIFFISDDLQYLELDWKECQPLSILPHLQRTSYCAGLKELTIIFKESITTMTGKKLDPLVKRLAQALSSLNKLEFIRLPTFLVFEPSIWCAMQRSPSIRKIVASDSVAVHQAAHDHLELGHGFENLTSLSCFPTSREATRLMTPIRPNSTLTTIGMTVGDMTVTDTRFMVSILSAIPDAFPRVEDVAILFQDCHEPLRLCHFTSLFRLPQLVGLSISTAVAANLSDDNYNVVCRSLPGLRTLSISPNPNIYSSPSATLIALSNIAAHCRCIESVTLFVDVSPGALPSPEISLNSFPASLNCIVFGPSTVDRPEEVGYTLCRMLLWCRPDISSYDPPPLDEVSEETQHQYEVARVGWSMVAETVNRLRPLFDAMNAALEERTGELAAAIQQKDARIAELEDAQRRGIV